MKKYLVICLDLILLFCISACGTMESTESHTSISENVSSNTASKIESSNSESSKVESITEESSSLDASDPVESQVTNESPENDPTQPIPEVGEPVTGKMHSMNDRAFLPDGNEFLTWEPTEFSFSKTYYVDQKNPEASDSNPGTEEKPFLTINHAAQIVQPGERVLVKSGVYRELVSPAQGGTDPQHIISYEAYPGHEVAIKGSEELKVTWESQGDNTWKATIPRELFDAGYNPFASSNYPQINDCGWWECNTVFQKKNAEIMLRTRGQVFQDGQPLNQVDQKNDLTQQEGSFWVDDVTGRDIYITTFKDVDPNTVNWEVTVREQCFAPTVKNCNYIRVKGFTMEHAGNALPFPQRGLFSTYCGSHWIIEDNIIRHANSIGMDLGGQGNDYTSPVGNHIVRRNTITDCGICGICGAPLYDTLIEDNLFDNNAWMDVEWMAECAAIKIHWSSNMLIRRNVVRNSPHGTGIYFDCQSENLRITQNTVIGCGSVNDMSAGPGNGAIYLEAVSGPAKIDNNFVWGSTYTNGIYLYFGGHTDIVHNMIGNCVGGGMTLIDESGRPDGNTGGNINLRNNIFVGNGWNLDLMNKENNTSDYNVYGGTIGTETALSLWKKDPYLMDSLQNTVMNTFSKWDYYTFRSTFNNDFNLWASDLNLNFADWQKKTPFDHHSTELGITAELDPEKLTFTWSVDGELPSCPVYSGSAGYESFTGNAADGETVYPGPLHAAPQNGTVISVDPRKLTE